MTATIDPVLPPSAADARLGRFNTLEWARSRYVGYYSHRQLRPVEVVLLTCFAADFSGCVVELGCGAGRVTGYLEQTARDAYGIDLSPAMITAARARYRRATFLEGDLRDLSSFATGSVDVVFAGCNVLDVFDDRERRATLREIHRVLAPGGLLVMSSHNRAHVPQLPGPIHVRFTGVRALAGDLVRIPLRIARHRRLSAMEREEPEYAIVNNQAHDFSLVHYFVSSDAQRRQLDSEGFDTLAVFDLDGDQLGSDDGAPGCLELHYAARTRPAKSR